MNGGGGAFLAGAIVGKMILDRTKWASSVNQVKQDEKTLGGFSQRTSQKFQGMGRAMTIAGTAIVGSLGAMIHKFVETGDWIDKMSKRTGISATALSELAYAADISGASLTDVERGIKRMAGSIVDANEGLTSYARAFDQMGVSVSDLMKMNPEQQFLTISEAIAGLEDPTLRAALAQDVFGRAGTALLPMMSEGKEGLQKLREEAHDLGIVFDQEAAAKAAKLKDAQTALSGSVKGLGFAMAETLVPAVTSLVQSITNIVIKINEWARAHPGLLTALVKAAAALGGVMLVLGPMLIMLPKIAGGLALLKGALTALLGPMGLVVAGVTAITVALLKQKAAQDKATEAAKRAAEAEDNLFQKLKAAADEAGLSEQEFLKLRDAYNGNAAAMAMAIKRGQEGKELQEALTTVSKEHADAIDEQKTKTEDYAWLVKKDYSEALATASEKTKTWLDYIRDQGLMTIDEKRQKTDELYTIIDQLNAAYEAGKIDLDEWTTSVTAAKDEITAMNTVVTQAAPPQREVLSIIQNMPGALQDQTFAYMTAEERVRDFAIAHGITTEKVQRDMINLTATMMKFAGITMPTVVQSTDAWPQMSSNVEQVENGWTQASERIQDSWTMGLKDMLMESGSLKDALGSVWGTIKDQFFTFVAQLISKWTMGFVANVLTGVGDVASGLTSGIGNAAEGLTSIFGNAASSAGGLLTNIGSIASSLNPGGMLGAAIGGFLGSLFGGGGKGFQPHDSGNLKRVMENSTALYPILTKTQDIHNEAMAIRDHTFHTANKLNTNISLLRNIKNATKDTADYCKAMSKAIKNVVGAQEGAIIRQTQLVMAHGRPTNPEVMLPSDKLQLAMARSPGNASVSVDNKVALQGTFITDREYTRQRLLPEILNALSTGAYKEKFKKELGLT